MDALRIRSKVSFVTYHMVHFCILSMEDGRHNLLHMNPIHGLILAGILSNVIQNLSITLLQKCHWEGNAVGTDDIQGQRTYFNTQVYPCRVHKSHNIYGEKNMSWCFVRSLVLTVEIAYPRCSIHQPAENNGKVTVVNWLRKGSSFPWNKSHIWYCVLPDGFYSSEINLSSIVSPVLYCPSQKSDGYCFCRALQFADAVGTL